MAVDDGGVSGVALGGLVEFAPDDTPRCVDRPGTAAFSYRDAVRLFETVYGFPPGRETIRAAAASGEGIVLRGRVGITSHFGDLLRRAGIPSRLETA